MVVNFREAIAQDKTTKLSAIHRQVKSLGREIRFRSLMVDNQNLKQLHDNPNHLVGWLSS